MEAEFYNIEVVDEFFNVKVVDEVFVFAAIRLLLRCGVQGGEHSSLGLRARTQRESFIQICTETDLDP